MFSSIKISYVDRYGQSEPYKATREWRGLLAAALLVTGRVAEAYKLDLGSKDSMAIIASSMVEDMMSFYTGNDLGGVPGLLPKPYYWWEAGALMGSLVDYWYYTGDTRWNDVAEKGLLFQVGPNNDYMPPNQTMTEGNDDQGFWGMAVLTAAESNFQNPPSGKPQWLALAQAVFNTQAARWENQDCGGGLRWQIFPWNNGYNYKNSISQACFFNIAARLARYTGNQSYADWADRTWDWMVTTQLLDTRTYYIYDGMHVENCSMITPYQWTYNAGAFLLGAAAMYNYSTNAAQAEIWRERVDGLLNGTRIFFTGEGENIMTEVACEPVDLCDLNQQSFKAYLSRWMAATTKWAPWTYDPMKPLLESSAIAAVSTCTGGSNGRMCGLKWNTEKWDNNTGVGQQMAAMEVVLANTIQHSRPPVTDWDGGTSVGDPGAGGADVGRKNRVFPPISTAEKAGAYVLTVLVILALVAGSIFVLVDENDRSSPSERLAKLRITLAKAGSWSYSLLTLRRQSSSQPKEKGVDRSYCSVGRQDHQQEEKPGNEESLAIHSCARTTQLSQHPVPKLHYYWRDTRSEPSVVEAAHPSGTVLEFNHGCQNYSYPQFVTTFQGETTLPMGSRSRTAGRVHRMETSWEEE